MWKTFPKITELPKSEEVRKWFTTSEGGGYNHGLPKNKDWKWSALPNCTSLVQGYTDYLIYYYTDDLELAIASGKGGFGNAKSWYKNFRTSWQRGQEAKVGAIACWTNNNLGHVEIVVDIDKDYVYLVGSNVNNKSWVYHKLKHNMYYSSSMTFQGFIYNPYVKEVVLPSPVERDETKHQVKIIVTNLRVRNEGTLNGKILGICNQGIFNVLSESVCDGYRWLEIEEGMFIAFTDDWGVEYIPEKEIDKLYREINRLTIEKIKMR